MIVTLLIFLLTLFILQREVTAQPVEILHGRLPVMILDFQTFVCMPHQFSTPFSSDDVAVHLSPATAPGLPPLYDASTVWLDHVTRHNFTTCVDPSAIIPMIRQLEIHWLAYRYKPSTGLSGVVSVPLWTAGTKCVVVQYPQRLTAIPSVLVTAMHERRQRRQDATTVWTEDITTEEFKLCLREIKNFDGAHHLIKVNWLVLSDVPPEWIKAKLTGMLNFPNTLPPPVSFKYSYCHEFTFPKMFFTIPTMLATPSHRNNIYSSRNIWPEHNAITYWIESITNEGYTICVKDLQPYRVHHDPILISYLVLGDLHPCLSVSCGNFASCKAYTSSDVRCECPSSCPYYEEQYCASNGVTYTNRCSFNQMVCNTGNQYAVTPGSCEAFVLKRGRIGLSLNTEYRCQTVSFGHDFTRNATIHAFVAIDYHNTTQNAPHDTAVAWVEHLTSTSLDACVLKAGRNDVMPPDGGLTFINYLVYQGSPAESVSGVVSMDTWWDGTLCKSASFPANKFTSPPYIVVTARHEIPGMRRDAVTLWIEDLTSSGFRVCARELQTFDCMHIGINVHWLAFDVLPENLHAERHKVTFLNALPPPTNMANAFCSTLTFSNSYATIPTLLLSPLHYTGPGGLVPEFNSITAWVENADSTQCRICLRESRGLSGHDQVSVTVIVLG